MKTQDPSTPGALRLASVWWRNRCQSEESFAAAIRRADLEPGVVFRAFDRQTTDIIEDIFTPLLAWKPHGVLLLMYNQDLIEKLRSRLPGVPMVSGLNIPPGLADTVVTVDVEEIIAGAVEYFRSRGLQTVGLYFSGPRFAEASRRKLFRALVPEGHFLAYPHEDQRPGRVHFGRDAEGRYGALYPHEEGSEGVRRLHAWLRKLPKPAGVLATEPAAARFLVSQCHALGLKVPEEVQVIGVDTPQGAQDCEPLLTSLEPPRARIGEVAMEALLRLARREAPPPPAVIRVRGVVLVPRDSTGLVQVGDAAVAAALKLMTAPKPRGVSATQIARLVGVSRTTLYKKFTAATGRTPAQYLLDQQLKEARRMLREGDATVAAVAGACGFGSAQVFTRCFRRALGQTPAAYRRQGRPEGGIR
jgi:LacI family transcriptional regulator